MKFPKLLLLLALAVAGLTACDNDDEGTARLRVLLTDDPGAYDAVYIDVQDVRVRMAGDGEDAWTSLDDINAGIYDLLELTAGVDTLLGEAELPEGELAEIRLVLGSENTVVVDDEEKPLSTPSAQQSGLKIKVDEPLDAGVTYTLLLDFDVARSIVQAGNSGNYNLKPVIRAELEATSGAISGEVDPAVTAEVQAINVTDTITTYTNESGAFMLRGVSTGTYTVSITTPDSLGLPVKVLPNVTVTTGETTDLGTIDLEN